MKEATLTNKLHDGAAVEGFLAASVRAFLFAFSAVEVSSFHLLGEQHD